MNVLKEEDINLKIKYTIPEYITKVGILVGPNVEWANPRYYKQLLRDKVGYREKILEISKDKVFEKDIQSKALVVYATLSKWESVDNDLQSIEVGNG